MASYTWVHICAAIDEGIAPHKSRQLFVTSNAYAHVCVYVCVPRRIETMIHDASCSRHVGLVTYYDQGTQLAGLNGTTGAEDGQWSA